MGLDMYLSAKRYFSLNIEQDKAILGEMNNILGLPQNTSILDAAGTRIREIKFQVGYWRKANAIHNYFVNEFADGVDNCEPMRVSLKDLEKLRDLCVAVLTLTDNGKKAFVGSEVLPTASGFFFGTTDYDEWYIESMKDTIAIIDNVLADPILNTEQGWTMDFEYQASW